MEEKLFGVDASEAAAMVSSLLADFDEAIEIRENGEQYDIYLTTDEMKFLRGLLGMQKGMLEVFHNGRY